MIRRLLVLATSACLVAVGCGTQVSPAQVKVADNGGQPSASAPPAGMQRAWLRGVSVDAPAAWQPGAVECGTPVADTLIRDYSGTIVPSCLRPAVKDLSIVWMGVFTRPLHDQARLGESTIPSDASVDGYQDATIDGVAVKETTQTTDDGRTLRLVLFLD